MIGRLAGLTAPGHRMLLRRIYSRIYSPMTHSDRVDLGAAEPRRRVAGTAPKSGLQQREYVIGQPPAVALPGEQSFRREKGEVQIHALQAARNGHHSQREIDNLSDPFLALVRLNSVK